MKRLFDKNLMIIDDGKGKLTLMSLAIPMFLESIAGQIISLVQGSMSAYYLDGFFVLPVNTAGTVFNIFTSIIMVAAAGSSSFISSYIGKGDEKSVKSIVGNTLFMMVVIPAILGIFGIAFGKQFLYLAGFGGEEYAEYFPYAIKYLRYRIIAQILIYWTGVYCCALRCYGRSGWCLVCALVTNILNAGLTALLFFVLNIDKEYIVLALNIVVVVSSVIGNGIGGVIFHIDGHSINLIPKWKWMKGMVRIGFPVSLSSISYSFVGVLTARLCATLSPDVYLAKIYAAQILAFAYLLGYAIGKANGVMISRCCGNGSFDFAVKMTNQTRKIVCICNLCCSLFIALSGKLLMKLLFNADDEVIKYAQIVFWLDILVEQGRVIGHVGEGCLSGPGDTIFMGIIMVSCCWVFGVGFAYLSVMVFGWGLAGMWISSAIDETMRGILYTARWNTGRWRKVYEQKIGSVAETGK